MNLNFNVLLRSEQTGGHVSLVENTVPPNWEGTPLHHHGFDEAWYVLEGALALQLGSEIRPAGPGTVTFAPRDTVHAVANHGDVPARYLLVCTPAGFERYFDQRQAEITGIGAPPEAHRGLPETHLVGPVIERA